MLDLTPLAVVNSQQKLGVAIAAALVVGWLFYIVIHLFKAGSPPGSEIELAPNRKPYFDDDTLETRKLDRALGVAVILLAVLSIGIPVYWVREPGRQEKAIHGFDHRAVHRGHGLFQPTDSLEHGPHFGCATCHGSEGQGGSTNYTITDSFGRTKQVVWAAPALNTVAYRYTWSQDEAKKELTQLRQVLVYGRAGTPMPAWGIKGGGPMNDQQIDDLVAYLSTPVEDGGLLISKEEAKAQSLQEAEQYAKRTGKSADDGEVLFNTNCSRCHTRGYSFGEPEVTGGGRFGPSLRGGVTVRQFPDEADMIKFITQGVEYGQPYGAGGIMGVKAGGMPHFGDVLTPEQIEAIVEYERSLP